MVQRSRRGGRSKEVHKPTYEETQNDIMFGPRCCMCATRISEDEIVDHLMESHVLDEYMNLARDVMEVNWQTEKKNQHRYKK